MMIYELDDTEKRVLLNMVVDRARVALNDGKPLTQIRRWYQFTVNITFKINEGSLGIRHYRQGEFIFCAQSRDDARTIAGHHLKGATLPVDVTRMIQIVDSVPIGDPHGEGK